MNRPTPDARLQTKTPGPERAQTDESLHTERKKTDQALAEKQVSIEESADQLVARARVQADAVLEKARDKADDKLETTAPGVQEHGAVTRERAREDDILQSERAAEDERIRLEREEAPTLATLLPLERQKTDRYLLTERARSDTALAHRDDFMGMVSHDLRNLLHGIVLHGAILSTKASDSDEGRRTVDGIKRIEGYVARMNSLIGDLVDVVSIEAGKLAVRPQRGDAAALLSEAVDAFALAASAKGIALEAKAVDPLPADFDHERMFQVLTNLISNAVKFTPKGGRIVVRGERTGVELRLSVSDTGPGIPGDILEAIFERFWQTGKDNHRGLGLGLYISKCIVDAHGGKIWVESKPGEGSAFHVTIPAEGIAADAGK